MKKTTIIIIALFFLTPLASADFPLDKNINFTDDITVFDQKQFENIDSMQSCQDNAKLYTFDDYYTSSSSTRFLTPEYKKLVVVTKGRPSWDVSQANFTTIKQNGQIINASTSIQSLDLQNHNYEVWAHVYNVSVDEEVVFSTSRTSRWTQGIYNFDDSHIDVERLRYAYLGQGKIETNYLTPGQYDMAFFDVSSLSDGRTKTVKILDAEDNEIESFFLQQPDIGYQGVKIINFSIVEEGNYTFDVTGSDSVHYFGYTCDEPAIPKEDVACQDALFNGDVNFTIENDKVIFQNNLETKYNFTVSVNKLNQNATTNYFNSQNVSINGQAGTVVELDTPQCAYNIEVMCTDEPSTNETVEFTDKPYCDETLDCSQAKQYFDYTFDSVGATATVSIPNYEFLDDNYSVSLASYEKQDGFPGSYVNLTTQVLFDFQTEDVGKGQTQLFNISIPQCAYQIDLVCGNPIYSFKEEGTYSSENRLIDADHPLGNEPLCTNISYPNCKDTNFIDPYFENETAQWIDTASAVELLLDEENNICLGNDDRRQEYSFAEVDEEYCLGIKNVEDLNVSNLNFEIYTDEFQAESESCYVITHFTQWEFNHVNNMSEYKTEFVFVDKTAPVINKTVSNIAQPWNGSNPYYNEIICENNECFELSNQSSITASCEDVGYNPSGVNTFEYELYQDGNLTESGDANDVNITFNESGFYKLNLYCEDNVEKNTELTQLYFIDEPTVPQDDPNITIEIEQKWSLIGFPELPENTSLESIFDNNLTKSVWTYNSTTQTWNYWTPNSTMNTLSTVKTGVGYWVQSLDSYEISYNKTGMYQNINQVRAGWNLVGIYKHEERNAECNFNSLNESSDDILFGSLFGYRNDAFTGYGWSDILSSTHGYWIHVNNDTKYVPSTC